MTRTASRQFARFVAAAVLAGGVAVALPQTASAAGEITAPSVVRVGNRANFTFVAGAETGAYTADLMEGTTLVARVGSGTQIDDLASSGQTATIAWAVPTTLKLEGTGYSLTVKAGATTLTSGTFEIAAPVVTGGTVGDSTLAPLDQVTVSWSATGVVGNRVAINLLHSDGKTRVALTKSTDNDGSELVTVPAKTGVGSWKIEVIPDFKHAKGAVGATVTIEAITTPTIKMSKSPSFYDGDDPEPTTFALGSHASFTLEGVPLGQFPKIGLYTASGKQVLDLGPFPTSGELISFDDPKLGALGPGAYVLKAVLTGVKVEATQALTLTAYGTPSITGSLSNGVTHGQEVALGLEYSTGGQSPTIDETRSAKVSIVATNGSKTIKLASKKSLVAGEMSFRWTVASTLAPGDNWKLQFLNDNAKGAVLAESSTFSVKKNPTTLAKDLPPAASQEPVTAAAAGTLTAASTLYAGATVALNLAAGTETGAYTVDLMKGTTLVARIASGTQVDTLAAEGANGTISWTIPTTMKLEGTGYTAVLKAGAATITSGTFAIATSKIDAVSVDDGSSTIRAAEPVEVTWSSFGAAGDQVAIELVDTAGKAIALVKQTDNTGIAGFTVPTTIALGDYTIKVRPLLKTASAGSKAITLATPSKPTITLVSLNFAVNPSASPIGGIFQVSVSGIPEGDTADIAVVNPSNGKVLMSIAKGVTTFNQQVTFLDKKLTEAGAGAYEIRVMPKKSKALIGKYNLTFSTSAAAFDTTTLNKLAAGVTQFEPVTLTFTSGVINLDVSLQLTNGTKPTVLEKTEVVRQGSGTWVWLPTDKVPAGTAWKLQIIDNTAKKGSNVLAESPAFTVKANPTILAKNLPK